MHFKVQRIENSSPKDRFLLTKELALFRSNQVQNVAYELYFSFKSTSNYYRIETTITFDLNSKESLIIDCGCSTINKITVNNVELSPNIIKRVWKMNALCIPKEYLLDERNVIYVKACNKFSKNGSGFHSFLDQNRKKEYCYTVCPPNFAHLIYPCFDQPDLKAHFDLKVKAPSKWTVISNMTVLETRQAPLSIFTGGKNTIWTFQKSPKISTYLFSIAAGDYMTVEPDTPTLVPMRLYCASDKYNYLVQQKQEFFDLVQAGIKFYNQFFGVDFPFEKYDQIFCPESKYIAMENPGMVCITENYIFLTQTSPSRKIQRAVTLLHELSHMWFGNLVTMKWWDDLWLNEGFATFISYHSLGQVSQDPLFKNLDVDFFGYKQDALEIDGLNSTHPVSQNVKDTEDATNIFDDITYAKGSAVLKHLMYIIGEQNFSKALTTYFERYKWSNADSKDFFGVIQEVLLEDETSANNYFNMEKWVSDWIETEGKQNISYDLNFVEDAVEISVKCENLPQRVSIIKHVCLETAVFYLDECNRLTLFTSQKFDFSEEDTTLIIPLGNIDPQRVGVVLNYKDYAYVDVIMDDVSMNFFLKNFSQLEPLVKVQFFFSMVKKVQLGSSSPIQLFKHIADEFEREEIPYLYSEYLIYAKKIFDLYLSESIKEDCAKILFPSLFKLLNTSRNKESDDKMVGLRFTIQEYIANFAYTNSDVLALFHWTQEIQPLTNYEQKSGLLIGKVIEEIFWRKLLDDSERDNIKRLYAINQPYYFNFVIGATASLNDKWVLWKKYVNFRDSVQSQYEISCIMKGFNNPYSKDRDIFAEKFFEDVILVFETHEAEYNTTFFTHLFPKHCKLDYAVDKVNNLLKRENICLNLRSLLEKKLQQLEISLKLEKFSQCKS